MKKFIVYQTVESENSWIINANTKEEAMEKFLNSNLTTDEYVTLETIEGDVKKVWVENWDDDDDEYEVE